MILCCAIGDFCARKDGDSFSKPFVFGVGVVVSGLEIENFADGRNTTEREAAISGKAVALISADEKVREERGMCEREMRTSERQPSCNAASHSDCRLIGHT